MKFFLLLILIFVQAGFVIAQSLVVTGLSAIPTSDPNFETISHLTVKNISSQSLNIICSKNIVSSIQGADDYFCWGGQCFGTSIFISPTTTIIAGEQSSTEFSGHFSAYGSLGIGVIEYCFYPDTDITDSTCLKVTYNVAPTSISDYQSGTKLGDFYPNPATEVVNFTFNGNLATLKLIDILGNNVKEILLNQSGIQKLDLSDMNKGIYFGNFIVNNEVVSIKKLLVK
jgi:hypothetical protein